MRRSIFGLTCAMTLLSIGEAWGVPGSPIQHSRAQTEVVSAPATTQPPAPQADRGPGASAERSLTTEDLERFFDGLLPYALEQGDIAGAEVAVVAGGRVAFMKGYGFADAKSRKPVSAQETLFRVGSVSKLFIWTAVMQLVEQGKLDLRKNVNDYLDFKIPPDASGRPITLWDLMTHTAGFQVVVKDLLFYDPRQSPTLREFLRDNIPARIFSPGKVVAYSNYGAALAAYIVQRVSGEPFAAYVARHILVPLGMDHCTFEQPLPQGFRGDMSKGYLTASGSAQPFEIVGPAPVGALTCTAADMARFMIAQLGDGQFQGRSILSPRTAQLMHSHQRTEAPGLNGFALGFYEESRNGQRIIGHSGDTQFFHSDLHLILSADVGLYVVFNSRGVNDAVYGLRTALFHEFMDRYFPYSPPRFATAATAARDARFVSGTYLSSVREEKGVFRFFTLFDQTSISQAGNAEISVSSLRGVSGVPLLWREIGPLLYRRVGGQALLAFVKNGRGTIDHVAWSDDPTYVLQPAPIGEGPWVLPLFIVSIIAFGLAGLVWFGAWAVHRHYDIPLRLQPQTLVWRRLGRIGGLLWILACGCWLRVILDAQGNLPALSYVIDPEIYALSAVGILAILGSLAVLIGALASWRDKNQGIYARLGNSALAVAAIYMAWFFITYDLVSFSARF